MPENSSPDTTRIDLIEIASGWLVGLDAGTVDVRAFEAWRDADPRHAAAFAEVAGAWSDMGDLRLLDEVPSPPPLDAGARQDSAGDAADLAPAPFGNRRKLLRAGLAVGTLALGAAGLTYRAAARESASTGIGESARVTSGSAMTVDLNTDSRIFWKDGDPLKLWLDRGEIAIRLTASHRLSLLTQGGTFHLMPGVYNARIRDASCELTVLGGGGTFGADGHGLRTGETALATAGKASVRDDGEDLARVTAWRSGTLVLNGESLDYALSEMNRYLEDKIVIGDPGLSRLRVGGTFATSNPAEFLQALRTSFAIRTRRDGTGSIVLTRS
ncbi:FecR family protein [Novosphingobium sp. MBES04]|uniref:FecR family protein n=1 Tax=Novosphingobium sp. MBES04 TaxID=1206458 RepID=UPI0006942F78|nr:DUF4880 domain-containing protein [Novosphingobium sp. MBES04]GAM07055.1 anti-feci sigma factor, fecr [Novosphingobium sp. MBES04]